MTKIQKLIMYILCIVLGATLITNDITYGGIAIIALSAIGIFIEVSIYIYKVVKMPITGVKGTHKGIKGLRVKMLQAKRVKKLRKYAQEKLIANAMIQPDVVAKVADIDAKISKLSK